MQEDNKYSKEFLEGALIKAQQATPLTDPTKVEVNSTSKYDKGFVLPPENTQQAIRDNRADSQSWLSQAGNSVVGGTLSGLATAVQDFSYVPQLFSSHWEENAISDAMIRAKEGIDEELPIYTKTDGMFDWNDGAFVWKALKGTLDSAVGFAIPGGVVSKGLGTLGKVAKLEKLASLLSKSPKVYEAMMSLGTGYVMNRMEGTMMGVELYNKSMKEMEGDIASGKITQADAERVASQKADEFRNWNTMFAITDAIGVHGIIKGEGFTRNIKNKGWGLTEMSMENPILQAVKEGGEEIGQNIIQSEKEYETYRDLGLNGKAMALSNKKNLIGRIVDFGTSQQALYEGMLGLVGGYPQHLFSKVVSGAYTKEGRAREEDYYNTQQKTIADTDAYLKSFNDINLQYAELKADALKRGDTKAVEALDKLSFTNTAIKNFTNGTTEHLERSLDDIINLSPEKAQERGYAPDYSSKAKTLKKEMLNLETDWLHTSKYINHEEVFLTKQTAKVHQMLYNNELEKSQAKENEVNLEANRLVQKYNAKIAKDLGHDILGLSFDLTTMENPALSSELVKPYYNEMVAELKGTPAYDEYFSHKISDLETTRQALDNVNNHYKTITSSKYQEAVKSLGETIKEKKKEAEAKTKKEEAKAKHKEVVTKVKEKVKKAAIVTPKPTVEESPVEETPISIGNIQQEDYTDTPQDVETMSSNNIEAKKADIEKRRPTSYIKDSKDKKSPLETFRNGAKREWDGVSVITGDRMKNLYVGIQLFVEAYPEHKELLDKFIKKENGTIGITNNNLSFVLNTLKKQGVTTESELGVKINAKYDAEQQETTTSNQSEIKANKADIERRIQEELKQLSIIGSEFSFPFLIEMITAVGVKSSISANTTIKLKAIFPKGTPPGLKSKTKYERPADEEQYEFEIEGEKLTQSITNSRLTAYINTKYAELAALENNSELTPTEETVVVQTDAQQEEVTANEISQQEYTDDTNDDVEETNIATENFVEKEDLEEEEYFKSEFGSNILAYLSRLYNGFTSREDIDNLLNEELKDKSILDPNKFQPGTHITLQVKDNDAIDMYIPGTKDKTTWGEYKIAHPEIKVGTEAYNNLVPIVILDTNGNEIADLHTTDWIRSENIFGDVQEDSLRLSKIRKHVLANNGKLDSIITRKTNGKLFKLINGAKETIAKAFPDKNLHIVYSKKGELKNVPTKVAEATNMQFVKDGITYIVVPVNKNSYIPLPLQQKKVNTEIAQSISTAISIWYKSKGVASNLDSDSKVIAEAIYNETGLNITQNEDLRKYVTLFINSYDIPAEIEAKIPKDSKDSKLKIYLEGTSVKSTTHLLSVTGNTIDFGTGAKFTGSLSHSTPENVANDLLSKLTSHIENMYLHINHSLLTKDNVKIPVINSDGTLSDINNNSSYKDFVRNNTETKYLSHNIGTEENPKYVYTIQPVIEYDTSFVDDANTRINNELQAERNGDKTEITKANENIAKITNPLTGEEINIDKDSFDEDFLPLTQNQIDYVLKSVNILNSDKAKQTFAKAGKAKWDLNKILSELQIPKEQIELLKNIANDIAVNGKTIYDLREQIALELASKYSYSIEINTATKENDKGIDDEIIEHNGKFMLQTSFDDSGPYHEIFNTKQEAVSYLKKLRQNPTNYYSNLTVNEDFYKNNPDWEYKEQRITTPLITPSIKGHAQFAEDNDIGWFRAWYNKKTGEVHVLEVQSDLFQKGRDRKSLIKDKKEFSDKGKGDYSSYIYEISKIHESWGGGYMLSYWNVQPNGEKNNKLDELEFKTKKEAEDKIIEFKSYKNNSYKDKENNFLQLLNKDNNWVTFFVKSIIQDSAKKGYEKVLFPSGNTASKVEGHTTLEEFKKQKEDRIRLIDKEIENINRVSPNDPDYIEYLESELSELKKERDTHYENNQFSNDVGEYGDIIEQKINEAKEAIEKAKTNSISIGQLNHLKVIKNEKSQLKQELERVEREGFGALKPIYNFYENTVTNILNKQYGKIQDYSNIPIKNGIDNLFEENKELAKIGNKQLYSAYLNTIFPYSKVKDIVYHFSNVKIDKPNKEKFSLSANINRRKGFFGINKNINPGNNFANVEGSIPHAMLFNMKNPDFGDFSILPPVVAKDETKDSAIIKQRGDINYYSVFEPDQIHILGSKQDIEGFKNFVKESSKPKVPQITDEYGNTWNEVTLDRNNYSIDLLPLTDEQASVVVNSFKNTILVPGLTANQQQEIVNDIAYLLQREVLEANGKTVNGRDVHAKYKAYLESLLAITTGKRKEVIQAVIDNYKSIENISYKYFSKLQGVQFKENVDNLFSKDEENTKVNVEEETDISNETESNLEKTTFEDSSLTQNYKNTISSRLKKFLSFIKTGEKNFVYSPQFVPFDEVYNTLKQVLSGERPDFDGMIKELEKNVISKPWLQDVVTQLNAAPGETKNDFVSAMTSHTVNMTFLMWQKDANDNYKLTPYSSNSVSISNMVVDNWYETGKLASVVIDKEGELVYNPEVVSRYNVAVQNLKDKKLEDITVTDVANTLAIVGIELHPEALKTFLSKGLSGQSFKSHLVSKTGLFANLSNKLASTNDIVTDNYLSDKSITKLAYLEAKFNKNVTDSSFKSGVKSISAHTLNKHITNQVRELKNNRKLVTDMLSISFSKDSSLLKGLVFTEVNEDVKNEAEKVTGSREVTVNKQGVVIASDGQVLYNKDSYFYQNFNFDYLGLEAIKEFGKSSKEGSELKNLSAAEHELIKIGLFMKSSLTQDSKGNRVAQMFYPTMSDKTTMINITTILHNVTYGLDGTISNKTIDALFDALVLPEYNRMINYKTSKNIKGYDKGHSLFYFLPQLNDRKELFHADGTIKDLSSDKDALIIIKNEIRNTIEELVKGKLAEWETYKFTKDDYLDADYMKNTAKKSIKNAATDYVVNYLIHNSNMFQSFIGDPALYFKSDSDNNMTKVEDTFINIGKRLAGDIAPGYEINNAYKDTFKTAIIADRKSVSESIDYYTKVLKEKGAKAYTEIEAGDAQEYTTLREHLKVMYGLGKITEKEFNRINTLADEGKDLSDADLAVILQPMKPVYVANKIELYNDVNRRIYIKSSSFPLVPQLTRGLQIDNLRVAMEHPTTGVDRVSFGTAAKVGAPNNQLNIFDDKGDFKDIIDFAKTEILTLSRSGFRIQQEVPYDKEKINVGTQERKLLFVNLLDTPGFNYKDKKNISGKELQEIYTDKYHTLFKLQHKSLMEELEFNEVTGKVNTSKLQKLLKKEAVERDFPVNDILGLELDRNGEFRIPLWLLPSTSRYESLLNAIVDNRVRKMKFNGASFILGSEEGFKEKPTVITGEKAQDKIDELSSDIVFTDSWTGKLKGTTEHGMTQALIPFKFRDQNGDLLDISKYTHKDKKNGKLMLDTKKLPKDLLKIFGFRIPTQGLNSMAQIEIVGFLPVSAGDLIITSKDFTKQMGSDFDVDKLYSYIYSHFTDSFGDVHKITSENIEKLINLSKSKTNKKEELSEKDITKLREKFEMLALHNEILDIHHAVLENTHSDVRKQMLSPLGFGDLKDGKDLANLIASWKKARSGTQNFNGLSDSYQKQKFLNATDGKGGTGVFSLDSVFNSLVQGKELQYLIPDKDGFNTFSVKFGTLESTGELSSPKTLDGKKYKSDVIAAYQSASVDNEKEQILDKLNINSNTYDVIRILAQLGFDEETISAFTNQDIIVDFVKEIKLQKSSLYGYQPDLETTIIQELTKKYTEGIDTTSESFINATIAKKNISTSELMSYIQNGNTNDTFGYAAAQIATLNKFKQLTEYGKTLKRIQSAINTDSAGLGKSLFASIAKEDSVRNLQNTPIRNAEKLIGNYTIINGKLEIEPTTINGFATVYGLFTNNSLWSKYFPYGHENIANIVTEINKVTSDKEMDTAQKEEIYKNVFGAIKSYLFTRKDLGVFEGDLKARREWLFKNLGKKINEFKINKVKLFQTNPFLNKLTTETDLKSGLKILKYNAVSLESFFEDSIYGGFLDLIQKNTEIADGYTTRQLADDFVQYAYLSGGKQQAVDFIRYIPIEYLNQLPFANKLRTLNFDDTNVLDNIQRNDKTPYYQVSEFVKQYVQHNSRKAPEFPATTKVEYLNKEKTQFTVAKDAITLSKMPTFVNFNEKLWQFNGQEYIQISKLGGKYQIGEYDANSRGITSIVNKQNPKQLVVTTKVDGSNSVIENVAKKPYEDVIVARNNKYKLNSGDITAVLDAITTNSTNPAYKRLAQEYLDVISKLGYKIDIKLSDVNAFGRTSYNKNGVGNALIEINNSNIIDSVEFLEKTILHETTHALTKFLVVKYERDPESLTAQQREIVGKLDKFRLLYKARIGNELVDATWNKKEKRIPLSEEERNFYYPGSNLQEFTAAAMENEKFQKYLAKEIWQGDKTMLDKFFELMRDLMKSLGINVGEDLNKYIYSDVLNLIKSQVKQEVIEQPIQNKEGIDFVFENNPELANSVYEALGFNNLITPNDKIVFGHPTIGKTFLKEKGINNFISFDDDFAEEINNFVNAHKGSLDKYQYKQSKPKEYIDFSLSLYDKAKAQAKKEGKILFTSSNIIFGNRINDFDKVINLEREEFFKRIGERKTTYDIVAWKDQIDNLISKVDPNKVINTRLYLSDLLKNTTIKPTDKIIWGHPAIGKSYAAKKVKMIDFDSYKLGINRKYNLYIAPGLSDTELRTDDKTREARENWRYESEENQALWNQFIRDVWQQAKKDAKEQGAILFASDLLVLREFGNEVDKALTMPDELFFERSKQRNNFIEGELGTKVWKGNLNRAVNNFKEKFGEDKVISTEKYLSDLFITPQQKQQAQQLYSQYLDTIFPDSKVKDIVYRGAKKGIEEQKQTTYWTFRKRLAETFKTHGVMNVRLRADEEGQLYIAIVDVKNPIKTMDISNSSLKEYKQEGKDAAIVFPTPINPNTGKIFEDFIEAIPFIDKNKNSELVVFEPEQIHILGNKQDIEGFKKFVEQPINKEIKPNEYYEGNIKPEPNTIFVFGSNPEGRHGAGAAKVAVNQFGAKYGQGEGLQGNAYALPTKDLRVKENNGFKSISPTQITESIKKLYQVARENPTKQFKIGYRNTTDKSLNGYTGLEMIDMFNKAGERPSNIIFSKEWIDTGKANQSTEIKPKIDSSKKINIYAGTNENTDLSNFAIRPFKSLDPSLEEEIDFKSVEQAFQYFKTQSTDPKSEKDVHELGDIQNKILATTNGGILRTLGKSIKNFDSKNWDNHSSKLMKTLLKQSFEQNPEALNKLLATGNAELTHTQDKGKWGTEFPKLLMEVRSELTQEQPIVEETSFEDIIEKDYDFKYFGTTYEIVTTNGIATDVPSLKQSTSETNTKFQERKQKILDAYTENKDVDKQNGKKFRNLTINEEFHTVEKPKQQEVITTDKKYELFPGVFANEGQKQAIDKLEEFLKSNKKEFLLEGKGGTGKTTIIKKVLEGLPEYQVLALAPSHKAKKVLNKSINNNKKKEPIKVKTLASALAIKLDENTGKFEPDQFARDNNKVPIKFAKYIIIDESSMVSDALLKEIKLWANKDAKIIFMGDKAQLPPVGQDSDSNVFNIDNGYELLEKMRQAKTSPIINIGTKVAANVESDNKVANPIEATDRTNKYDNVSNSSITWESNENKALDGFVADFKSNPTDTNNVKIITFNNQNHNSPQSVKNLNIKIRSKLYGDQSSEQFLPGELVTAYSAYSKDIGADVEEQPVQNADDFIIKSVEKSRVNSSVEVVSKAKGKRKFDFSYDILYLELLDDEGKAIPGNVVPVIADSSKVDFDRDMQHLWSTDTQLGFALQKQFADIQYGYAITSHKAQGSTYKNVYVMEDNIMGASNGGTIKAKNQSLYVAVSRPTTKLVMVSNKNTNVQEDVDVTNNNDIKPKIDSSKKIEDNIEETLEDFLPLNNKFTKNTSELTKKVLSLFDKPSTIDNDNFKKKCK